MSLPNPSNRFADEPTHVRRLVARVMWMVAQVMWVVVPVWAWVTDPRPPRQWRRRWGRRAIRVVAWGSAGLGVVVLLGLMAWLVWKVLPALYAYVPNPKDRADAEASTRTGIVAGLAGLAALGSLVITTRNVSTHSARAIHRSLHQGYRAARQRQT
jgi:hypothetical protein